MQSKALNLIIRNGLVITSSGETQSDVWIKGGKVKKIAPWGEIEATGDYEVYDARHKWVMPGLIDSHMHIAAPLGGIIDIMDFKSVSKTAAYGGDTTIMDFSSTLPGMSIRTAVKNRLEEMKAAKLYASER